MAQQDEYQHVGPGQFQEVVDHSRQLPLAEHLLDHRDGLLAGAEQTVAALGCLHGTALAQFDLVPQGGDELVELFQQAVKQLQVAVEVVDHAFHRPVDLRQQAAFVAFAAVQHAGLGHGVEQAAGRVVVLGEQGLVLYRHL